ncbi:hypothetical protein [Kitasatospora sp. NPDC088346]|uniref:hypothetical protein n=1 Tax=Kitasatospora sp. NPDC088346 TaxID=3364073 RepID=UPI003820B8B3
MPEADEFTGGESLTLALRELVADAPAAIPLPYGTVRERGVRRRRRRRAALGVTAAVCAAALLGGGGLLWQQGRGAAAGPVAPAASPGAHRTETTVVVPNANLLIVRTGSEPARPLMAAPGWPLDGPGAVAEGRRYTVTAKRATAAMDRRSGAVLAEAGPAADTAALAWCVGLTAPDGAAVWICTRPEGLDPFRRQAGTPAAVGLSEADARWYFEHTEVGDLLDVVGPNRS